MGRGPGPHRHDRRRHSLERIPPGQQAAIFPAQRRLYGADQSGQEPKGSISREKVKDTPTTDTACSQ